MELWSRCVPEGFIFKVGDIISLDVQHYRPEKIHFARKVKMQKYRTLGRETGVVCAVKDQGFGFVRSHLRDTDMYFRTNEILGSNGENVAEAVVAPGMVFLISSLFFLHYLSYMLIPSLPPSLPPPSLPPSPLPPTHTHLYPLQTCNMPISNMFSLVY